MSNVAQPKDDRLVRWAGRNYARFAVENNVSVVPVDEPEEVNFDEVHGIFEELFGRIILPDYPIDDIDEPAVLDCGFGKGQWLEGILDYTKSDAWCVGVDIYTGQGNSEEGSDDEDDEDEELVQFEKKRWNLNVSFRTSRDPDLRPETYHLINSRVLTDGINSSRWPDYVKELKSLLKPGGWLQMVEVHCLFQSDSGQTAHYLERWWQYYQDTMNRMGKDPRVGSKLGSLMRDAGFERIQYSVERLPIGRWMTVPGRPNLGKNARETVTKMIRSTTLWPFRQRANPCLTEAQYEGLLQGAERELQQDSLKLYLNVHFAYGRRPRSRRR
ncbi:hypothetical protein M409DRAFT_30211 [Zasmidium cellare ATCC 36951]|uniref:Methyltransferase domain-containing protein n=1 Tax=Zasmidium cellare ATCC 36951 TaxID=1080233 RepID=A0A6A6BXA2_ZASCE|nr:uncharacterized protein M409DRAFT_30211 [Zasmidium cellare ATCC 36951]KAF2159335.1 hypothetical protein M409DRAFT_30211 [Zasmidium cellare ATCC 36951]